jgi:hypothetical protein
MKAIARSTASWSWTGFGSKARGPELEHALDDRPHPLQAVEDQPQILGLLGRIELPLAEDAGGVDHAAERVVDFMGDAGGERAGGGQALGGEELAFRVGDAALRGLDVLLEPAVVVRRSCRS